MRRPTRSYLGAIVALSLSGSALANDLIFTPDEDKRFSWESYEQLKSMDFTGEEMIISTAWLGPDKKIFESVIDYFEQATGAVVKHAGSDSFEQQIVIDLQAGSAPNIAVFPQPGLAADLAQKGFLLPLGNTTRQWVADNYAAGSSWVDLGTYANAQGDTDFYAMYYKADLKSLVWYVPENFEDAGYEIPQSMEELKSLTEQIAANGETPWCIGLGSGAATGWPGTDWVEEMMLRTQTPQDYDRWVKNEIRFDDPKVIQAIEDYGWFSRNDKFVDGGKAAVATYDFRDNPKGLFSSPARCYMHRQASFIPAFFPENVVLGEDADFFYFPSYAGKDLGKPILGGGTLMTITKDSPATRGFIEFIKAPIAHEIWMAQAGFLTPHKNVNMEAYANDTLRKQGQIMLDASTFRFDASDLMPGKIGAGAFWTGMVDYSSGKSAQEIAQDIQKQWDTLK